MFLRRGGFGWRIRCTRRTLQASPAPLSTTSSPSDFQTRNSFAPATWRSSPAGWFLFPSSNIPANMELPVTKLFDFNHNGAQVRLLGEGMAMAEELQCIPVVQWFFSQLTITVPPTEKGETLALYFNDVEHRTAKQRNGSVGGVAGAGVRWSEATRERVEARSREDFSWVLTVDKRRTLQFLQETFIQWHHRADYLVARMSREKREFRQDLTLGKIIEGAKERKRRMTRRKEREQKKAENIAAGRESEYDTFSHDVLPREIREVLDRESDGMEDVRMTRNAPSVWNGSRRSTPNMR